MKKTKVINLFGGSGIGKSTIAAELFVELKKQGKSVELVQEFVKEWAWQKRKITELDQIQIVAEQIRRETQLYGKVDYLITDCPLMMCACYAQERAPNLFSGLKHTITTVMDIWQLSGEGVFYHNYLLARDKAYVAEGRYETEQEAKMMDKKIELFLLRYDVKFINLQTEFSFQPIGRTYADFILNSLGLDTTND